MPTHSWYLVTVMEKSTRAQGWSQSCVVPVLDSMTCDTLIGSELLCGWWRTCRTGKGGHRKGAGG